jgi:transglutaminase-like putative cysteine protease
MKTNWMPSFILFLLSLLAGNSQAAVKIQGDKYFLKDGKNHRLSLAIESFRDCVEIERCCAQFFFNDSVSATFEQAFSAYCQSLGQETDPIRYTDFTHVFIMKQTDSVSIGDSLRYASYVLTRLNKSVTKDKEIERYSEWNVVYDAENNRLMQLEDILLAEEAERIKTAIGKRRLQLFISSRELKWGYIRKGELVLQDIVFCEHPDVLLDSFKEKLRKHLIRDFLLRQEKKKAAVPLAYFNPYSFLKGGHGKPTHQSNLDYNELAREITKGCINDFQRIKAIYLWICSNISYDTDYKIYYADQCFLERKGVCNAYCELFNKIANCVGVRTELISGKTNKYTIKASGHCWLFAYVDKGYGIFLDPTWGAGYVDPISRWFSFRKDHMVWFNVDPEQLILSHYPNEETWQFLDDPIKYEDFQQLPKHNELWLDYGLNYHDIYVALRHKKSKMPVFNRLYQKDEDSVKLVCIPFRDTLLAGHTYTFMIKANDAKKFWIENGGISYSYQSWRNEGDGFYSIEVKVKKAETLKFYYNRRPILKYSIEEPK